MRNEVFKFELKYRLRRPETYLFFFCLLAFSTIGVDFVMQGIELGGIKKNAPLVIAKTMGAITGIFMILASMIMGMPILRDDHYDITELFHTTPVNKFDFLSGRFLGSLLILILVFCGVPLGMMLGELMPWHIASEMLAFNMSSYLNAFVVILLPTLFFGAAVFFVTGMLSRKLLVVYTQGIFVFVVFVLTKSISNLSLQSLLDPFSLTTLTQFSEAWSIVEKNTTQISFQGVMLWNKLFWVLLGVLALIFGYNRFSFTRNGKKVKQSIIKKLSFKRSDKNESSRKIESTAKHITLDISLPDVGIQDGIKSTLKQFFSLSMFYFKSLLKETSFWAIVIAAIIIIIINSVNLGTVFGVDSLPLTHLIIAELQELSGYFFVIILLFYSGELYWKERSHKLGLMVDVTSISSFIQLASKVAGLICLYMILMLCLIVSGMIFQMSQGYYHFDIPIYFSGFFIEILPFLTLYTIAAFFFQALVNNKFLGVLVSLVFFIVTMLLEALGFNHVLINYGGGALQAYSEMNAYGYFLTPYVWIKFYWFVFGSLAILFASLFAQRGVDSGWKERILSVKPNVTPRSKIAGAILLLVLVSLGSFLYFQIHILNEVASVSEQQKFRVNYEKTLKQFEHLPQLNIVEANLNLEMYPSQRSYDLEGEYILKNETSSLIQQVHIQKMIESDIKLDTVYFSVPTRHDAQYGTFEYQIYHLAKAIEPGDSIVMNYKQSFKPQGYSIGSSISSVVRNGSTISNKEFPRIGYDPRYELNDERDRAYHKLNVKSNKAEINDQMELQNARSGSDSQGVRTRILLGTEGHQTAVTTGTLINSWNEGGRNYYHYENAEAIINLFHCWSAEFHVLKDHWVERRSNREVDLEIYYHPRHARNLDNIKSGMKAALEYNSYHFSPYQYDQLRIVEVPNYHDYAQSLPNTIQYAESMGFTLDVDKEKGLDMVFFITAHEVAHQWWGMQVEAANVKGKNFILETLAQYSALMVFKEKFSDTKYQQLLILQDDLFQKGLSRSGQEEPALYMVEDQEFIYYNKGALVMAEIEELIGEEALNENLNDFIKDWNSKNGLKRKALKRYASSIDLIDAMTKNATTDQVLTIEGLLKQSHPVK